jgi:hypothetical protein
VFFAQRRDELFGHRPRRRRLPRRQRGITQQRLDAFGFPPPVSLGDRTPRTCLTGGLSQKGGEGTVLHGPEISPAGGWFQIKESSRFLKKAAQKFLLCWVMGVVGDNAHDPAEQSFFATFCSQKVGLVCF